MREVAYWVALSRIPKFGTVRFRKLEAFFGDLGHAWDAGLAGLKAAGIEDRVAQEKSGPRPGNGAFGEGRHKGVDLARLGIPGHVERDT